MMVCLRSSYDALRLMANVTVSICNHPGQAWPTLCKPRREPSCLSELIVMTGSVLLIQNILSLSLTQITVSSQWH